MEQSKNRAFCFGRFCASVRSRHSCIPALRELRSGTRKYRLRSGGCKKAPGEAGQDEGSVDLCPAERVRHGWRTPGLQARQGLFQHLASPAAGLYSAAAVLAAVGLAPSCLLMIQLMSTNILQDQVSRFFSNHYHRRVRVARNQCRHNGTVDHAQAIQCVNA